jgi:hypothetical protein
MIASLLPGFRDFRTPLVVGYLWLVAAWILLGPLIPDQKHATGIIGSLYGLSGWIGVTVALTILTFAAYLLGLLLSSFSLKPFFRFNSYPGISKTSLNGLTDLIRRKIASARQRGLQFADLIRQFPDLEQVEETRFEHAERWNEAMTAAVELEDDPENATKYLEVHRWEWLSEPAQVDSIIARTLNELRLAELSLQVASKDIYDKYDRTKAESDFRRAIAVPLGILGVAIGVRVGIDTMSLLVGVIPIVVGVGAAIPLELSAGRRERDASDFILQAIMQGVSKAPTLELIDNASRSTRNDGIVT